MGEPYSVIENEIKLLRTSIDQPVVREEVSRYPMNPTWRGALVLNPKAHFLVVAKGLLLLCPMCMQHLVDVAQVFPSSIQCS